MSDRSGAPLRADHAADIRAFADEVRALRLADRRDPEAPILAKRELEQRMRRRADQVSAMDEPRGKGPIHADPFKTIDGRRVRVEVRRAPLKKAA